MKRAMHNESRVYRSPDPFGKSAVSQVEQGQQVQRWEIETCKVAELEYIRKPCLESAKYEHDQRLFG